MSYIVQFLDKSTTGQVFWKTVDLDRVIAPGTNKPTTSPTTKPTTSPTTKPTTKPAKTEEQKKKEAAAAAKIKFDAEKKRQEQEKKKAAAAKSKADFLNAMGWKSDSTADVLTALLWFIGIFGCAAESDYGKCVTYSGYYMLNKWFK